MAPASGGAIGTLAAIYASHSDDARNRRGKTRISARAVIADGCNDRDAAGEHVADCSLGDAVFRTGEADIDRRNA
jgi:hypothetical protein